MLLTPEVRRELAGILGRLFGDDMRTLREMATRVHPSVRENLPGDAAGPRAIVDELIQQIERRDEFATLVGLIIQTYGDSLDAERLRELVGSQVAPPAPLEADSPFIGLHSFSPRHASMFFGRTALIETIVAAVHGAAPGTTLLVHGLGGVGKSSLLRAGLIPSLGTSVCRYQRCIGFDERAGFELVDDPDNEVANEAVAVWVIDQFEAGLLHLQPEQRASSPAVIEHLKSILAAQASRRRIILAFKQEFLADVEALLLACGGPPPRRLAIAPMRYEEVVEVLMEPTRRPFLQRTFYFEYDDGLAADIAADLCRDRASPVAPTLQLLMRELWVRRRFVADGGAAAKPRILRETYQELRSAGGFLQNFVMAQLKPEAPLQSVFESGLVFDLLWYLMDDATLTGRSRSLSFIAENFPQMDSLRAVISLYCARGLLVEVTPRSTEPANPPAAGQREWRLVHDSLVPILVAECRTSQKPGIRAARVLRTRAGVSEEAGVPLLTAEQLALVELGIHSMHRPTGRELEVLTASRERRAGEQARVRMRWCIGGLALSTLLVMASLWVWTTLQFMAVTRQNLARSLALYAEHEVTSQNPRAALALARRAFELESESDGGPTAAVIDRALRRALALRIPRQAWRDNAGELRDLLWIRGGIVGAPAVLLAPAVGGPEIWREGRRIDRLELPVGAQPLLFDLAASPQGDLVAAASSDGCIYVWDLAGELRVRTLRPAGAAAAMLAVAVAADGRHVAAGAVDGRVFTWERDADRPLADTESWRHWAAVNALTFVAPGQLASVGSDGRLYVGRPGDVAPPHESRHGEELYAIASPGTDGTAVYGGETGQLYLLGKTPALRPEPATAASWAPVHALQWATHGREVVSAHGDGKVRRWDRSPDQSRLAASGEFSAHAGSTRSLGLDLDGPLLLTAGEDGYVRSWDLATPVGEPREARVRGHGKLTRVRIDRDEPTRIVTRTEDGCTQQWEAASLREVGQGPQCRVSADGPALLAEHADLQLRAAGHRLSVELLKGTETRVELEGSSDWRLGWIASNGLTIAAMTSDGELRSWERAGDQWLARSSARHGGPPVQTGALSPDGRWLVYADTGDGMYRWQLGVTDAGERLPHAAENVAALAFSPDGRWLATGGRGQRSNLQLWRWDAQGSPPIELGEETRRIVDLLFLPGGEAIVVAAADGSLRRHVTLVPLAEAACEQLRRDPEVFAASDGANAMLGDEAICSDLRVGSRVPDAAPPRVEVAGEVQFSGCDQIHDSGSTLQCVYLTGEDDGVVDAGRLTLWVPGAAAGECEVTIDDQSVSAEEVVMDDGVQLTTAPWRDASRLELRCGSRPPWTLLLGWKEPPDTRPVRQLLTPAPAPGEPCDRGIDALASVDADLRPMGYRHIVQSCLMRAIGNRATQAADLQAALAAVERGVPEALRLGQLDAAHAIVLGAAFQLNWGMARPDQAQALLRQHDATLARLPESRVYVAHYLGGTYFAGGSRQQRDAEAELRVSVKWAHRLDLRDAEFYALQTLAQILNVQRREEEAELLLARAEALVPEAAPDACRSDEALLAGNRGWAYLLAVEAQRRTGDPRPLLARAMALYADPACADGGAEDLANATANLSYAECLMGNRARAAALRDALAATRATLPPRLQRFIEMKVDLCIGEASN